LKGLRLGILDAHRLGREMEAPVLAAFDDACAALTAAGAILTEVEIPELAGVDTGLHAIIAPEASVIHADWFAQRPQDYADLTRQQIEAGFGMAAVDYVQAQRHRQRLTAHFLDALAQVDAVLSPTAPWVAPLEDPAVLGEEGMAEARRTAPANLTGLPALTVNCGFSPTGLPIGLQITTRPGADELCLGIGVAYEEFR